MTKSILQRQAPLAAALGGGACLTLAFPNWECPGLGWIGPGLLLASSLGGAPRRSFGLGFLGGLAFHLTSLAWLLRIPFPWGAVAGWLALGCYCALYTALWVWLCGRLLPDRGESDGLAGVAVLTRLSWGARALWGLNCAALWTALEMVRGRFLTGFPWNFLGASQFRMLPVIQLAAWTGVYGVGFLMVWFSAALLCAAAVLTRGSASYRSWMADMILPMLAVSALTVSGFDRVAGGLKGESARADGARLRVALVQPAIPQTMIFDPAEGRTRFDQLLALSEKALARHPDLLVWPEGAMPPWTEENVRALTNLVSSHQVWMVFGADDVGRNADGKRLYYNSALLFGPDGSFAGAYRKRRLVIFGEYIPLMRWLPFLRHLTPIEEGFSEGDRPGDFHLTSPNARLGVFICFEDAFPDPTRDAVRPDTDALLNLTNDGWFGESAAQWQHAGMSVFRAVESGVPLLRCTNNGLTCWIDQFGRVRQFLEREGNIYLPGIMIADLPLPQGAARSPTFYHRHGDLFGWVCVFLAGLRPAGGLARAAIRPRLPGPSGPV